MSRYALPTRSGRSILGSVGVALAFVLGLFVGPAQAVDPAPTTGVISGTVFDSSGHGINAVPVLVEQYAANQDGTSGWSEIPQNSYASGARPVTGAAGTWTTTVPAGTYRLAFLTDGYEPLYYSSSATVENATDVVVAAGATVTGRNVTLVKPGVLQGKVLNPDGSLADFSGYVVAYQLQTVPDPRGGTHTQWVDTGESGNLNSYGYAFTLPHGSYRLQLISDAGDRAPLYYPASSGIDNGTDVTISSQQTTIANFTLHAQSAVSGTAVLGSGAAVGDVDVYGWTKYVSDVIDGIKVVSLTPVRLGTSATNGTWAGAVDPGTWRFQGIDYVHPDGWYLNATAYGNATDVQVAAGIATGNLTLRMGTPPPTAVVNTLRPSISGQTAVGQVLTADPGVWNPVTGPTFSYQWLSDGTPISGATAKTYTTTFNDLGAKISVLVTGAMSGLVTGTATSVPTAGIALLGGSSTPTNSAAPTIAGDPQVGKTLTATTGTWSPAGDYGYQWLVGGQVVSGANQPTYSPLTPDVGKVVSVRVYDTADGLSGKATSGPTAAVTAGALTNTALPVISGVPAQGNTLSATTGAWAPAAAGYAYQWFVDGDAVAGATTSSLLVPAAAVGKRVTVKVTASLVNYAPGQAISAPTAPVAATPPTFTHTVAPTISGVQRYGRTLIATVGATQPSAEGLTIQWYRNGQAIPGATTVQHTILAADLGHHLTVAATYTKPGYTSARRVSAATPLIRSLARTSVTITTPRRHGANLAVAVTAPGVSSPTGRIDVYVQGRHVRGVQLRDGRVVVRLSGLRRGKLRFDVVYRGSASTSTAQAQRTARVR